jgi:hypothetical protein
MVVGKALAASVRGIFQDVVVLPPSFQESVEVTPNGSHDFCESI